MNHVVAGVADLDTTTILLLLAAALLAGWIDAVVGGGGLVQLPALLLVPGISPLQALATNKLAGIMGTSVSAAVFYRRVQPGLRTAAPMALAALLGGAGGAALASFLPGEVITPIVLVALVVVAVWTVARPGAGRVTRLRYSGVRHTGTAAALGLGIGAYDGLVGPGTGSFLVIGLVGLLGYAFLEASANAKIINTVTNLGALIIFALQGAPLWVLGLMMGVANILGAYVGARMAVARGSAFVRAVFLVVVGGLILRLGWDVLGLG
ncbi:TSUP family transporter [Actinotalea sp. BY-33]|uniref:Probable membrane transporter protein n=1 Tax=Actinotalea soli TaxID=2819234 RepID=A0A939RX65_9CELL|nr:TSUP family transporter [Actinotalea soli]MBO1752891.1 TSUP family transporter [Actinotalea soli]